MKKVIAKLNVAIIAATVSVPAMAAPSTNGLCQLIQQMQGVFKIGRAHV